MENSKKIEDLTGEIWKDIPNYEGLYKISNFGRVKRLQRINKKDTIGRCQFLNNKIMTPSIDGTGRLGISLIKNSNIKRYSIHRLVAISFIINPDNKECVHHIDDNPLNNNLSNLMWVTKKENSQFASQAGRLKQRRKKTQKGYKINTLSSIYTDKDIILKDEKWIFINEYNKEYQISNYGRLKSFKKQNSYGKLIKPNFSGRRCTNGNHLFYHLSINGNRRMLYAHRLVAIYFIENPYGKLQVNHLDGNKQNNHISNLEWVTPLENNVHALKTGLRTDFGEGHSNSKLNTKQVIEIRELHSNGLSCSLIAKRYNMKRHSISGIVRRLYWKHI